MSGQSLSTNPRPTFVRHFVLAVTTLMAVLLYLDRFALGIASEYIREDLRMTQSQMSWFLSAFFWSYALAQVPAGLLSDWFGARRMLTLYIVLWSAFTGMLGASLRVWHVLVLRLFFGVAQAGAYPTAGGLIRLWYPISSRGVANSIVALGGRAGGVLAPILTAWLITQFTLSVDPALFTPADVISDKFYDRFDSVESSSRDVVERLCSNWPKDLLNLSKPQDGLNDLDTLRPVTQQISFSLKEPNLFNGLDLQNLKLPSDARTLLKRRRDQVPLSDRERVQLNRQIFEAVFAGSVKQYKGAAWRPTVILYGTVGIAIALAFLIVSRNSPRNHPWCNEAERSLIADKATEASMAAEPKNPPFPLRAMVVNLSLWGNSLMQVFTNIGWVFVVTWLPRYLDKVHHVSLEGQAWMTAIPTAAGIFGMYAGGWWTDRATTQFGRKWGRRLPVVVTRFTAGAGYAICFILGLCFTPNPSMTWLPWAYIAALCLMVFSVDMGNPAVWGYAQDVGGKFTGSVLGWANMWGNLGAAVAPLIYNWILGENPTLSQWNAMFGLCVLAFILSGLCGLVMDSTKTLIAEPSTQI